MKHLSIFGTSSDAGKSTLSFAITYLLHHRGIKVAPFKAQNVSNNSQVTDKGGEIAIPQFFAAESIGLKTTPNLNPILLKSGSKNSAHMIVNGVSVANKDVREYYRDLDSLKPHVAKAFESLTKEYECIVAEGAGSPVELNLMDKDLSNIFIANTFNTKIILVADIERGGVFASIYGVYNLLPPKLQQNVIGVIVNKFRGDISLFDEGVSIIEDKFGLKVLGVVGYKPLNLGFEDSQSLMNYTQDLSLSIIKVGVLKLPHISNFTDFEPLVADAQLELSFISSVSELASCDALIIPGSKRVVEDLAWLKTQGFAKVLQKTKKLLIGVCGGYEMMFSTIYDAKGIESDDAKIKGLKIFKGDIEFLEEKVVQKGIYNTFGIMTQGYEVHNGVTKKRSKKKKNFYGTFIHGIFDNDELRYRLFSAVNEKYTGYNFKNYKAKTIKEFARHIDECIDMDYIKKALLD